MTQGTAVVAVPEAWPKYLELTCPTCDERVGWAQQGEKDGPVWLEPSSKMVVRSKRGMLVLLRPRKPEDRSKPGQRYEHWVNVTVEHCGGQFNLARAGYRGDRFNA